MQYNLYKPNAKSTGCAFSFKIITKDKEGNPSKPTFLIQAIKQASWDSNKRTGSFSANAKDPEKNIYCKINEGEAWSFGVIKNSALKFGIGIEKGEARTLKTLLELYLTRLFQYEG
jgi:hypothetical protein